MKIVIPLVFIFGSFNVYCQNLKPVEIKFKDGIWIRDAKKKNEAIFYEKDNYSWYLTYRISGNKVEDIKIKNEEPLGIINNKLTCKPINEVSLSYDEKYKGGRFKKVYCFSLGKSEHLELESYCNKEKNQYIPISKLDIGTAVVRIECGK